MQEEIAILHDNGNWEPVSPLDAGIWVIPSVWTVRRKRRLVDGKLHKWKARLNLHGSKQVKGLNF
jgi:hypothetical protein